MDFYNIEAEQASLGNCIIEPDALNHTLGYLRAKDFYFEKHKIIYRAIQELTQQGKLIDLIILSDYLKNNKLLNKAGGLVYLTTLCETVPVAQNIEEYNRIIKEKARTYKIYKILEYVKEGKIELTRALTEISKLPEETEDLTLNALLKKTIEVSNYGTAHKLKLTELNRILGGVDKGEIITIGGYASNGKTTLALSMAIDFCYDQKSVLYLSAEMTPEEIARRILSNLLPKPVTEFRQGKMQKGEKDALLSLADTVSQEWKLQIKKVSDTDDISKYIRQYEPDIVFIDYLQNLNRRGARGDYEKVTANMKDIHTITFEKETTTFVLSQFRRKDKNKPIQEPRIDDLRDSGRIEEISNIVILLYWEARLKETVIERTGGEPPESLWLRISKNRDGKIGRIKLAMFPEYCQVRDFYYGI